MNDTPSTRPVNSAYGAPMGRHGRGHNVEAESPLYLRRVRLDAGGYDPGGAYWGVGVPLFEYFDNEWSIVGFLRAADREAAKRAIREDRPDVKFHR